MDEFVGLTDEQKIDCVLSEIKSAARCRNMEAEKLRKIFDAGFVAAYHLGALPEITPEFSEKIGKGKQ